MGAALHENLQQKFDKKHCFDIKFCILGLGQLAYYLLEKGVMKIAIRIWLSLVKNPVETENPPPLDTISHEVTMVAIFF